ncbi:hypothetical protein [Mycobacterium lepromatosis]|nr:hypothetical protein [Mycobacterium lepromatosis]
MLLTNNTAVPTDTGSMVAAAGEWQHMTEKMSSGVVEPLGEMDV